MYLFIFTIQLIMFSGQYANKISLGTEVPQQKTECDTGIHLNNYHIDPLMETICFFYLSPDRLDVVPIATNSS